jgi:ssDNA-binding replication factor A large subunit
VSFKLGEIIDLIVSKSGKSKEEVAKLIEAKKKELDGYVTDEGAASLVARELGLDLFEKQSPPELKLTIRDLVAGMTGVSLNLRVQRIFPVRTFTRKQGGEGKVANIMGTDATGLIRVVFWGDHTKPFEDREIDEGDILRVINGRVKTGLRDQLEIHLGSGSRIMLNPPDVNPDEFPETSLPITKIASLEDGMNDIHVKGTITAKYRKTTFSREDSEGVVASLALSDESGQTRLVLWDEQTIWFDKLDVNNTIRVESGYVRLDRNNNPELHLSRRGRIITLEATSSKAPVSTPASISALKDLKAGDYPVTVGVKVIENQGLSTFTRKDGTEGKRLVLILADKTGQARAVAWGSAAEALVDLTEGIILKLEGASCRVGLRQELELHINKSTRVTRNPPKMKISSPSTETLLIEKSHKEHQQLSGVTQGNFITVRGTIVQVIHQRILYEACPNCSRKVTVTGNTINCPSCGTIPKSEPRLIAKIVIDDGTENMRASFFGESAEKILGISAAEAKAIIEETGNEDEALTKVEDSLLGREVIISGRVSLSNFSNELEISVSEVQEANPVEIAGQLIEKLKR